MSDSYEIRPKPTIEELERILNAGGDHDIEILPNGEVRSFKKGETRCFGVDSILTAKEPLGSFY